MRPVKKHLENEKGIVLVIVMMIISILLLIGTTSIMSSNTELKMAANFKTATQAFYLAEAGIERTAAYLNTVTDIDSVLTTGTLYGGSQSLGAGAYSVVIANNAEDAGGAAHDTDGKVVVTSTGSVTGGSKRVLEVIFYKPSVNPPGIRGAVTANYNVGTLGTMTVDGRDHDINGNLTGGTTSLFGVSAGGAITEGGNSKIGGETSTGTLVAPTKTGTFGPPATGWATACEQNGTWSKPLSPDAVLGWPEGTLKKIAQRGTAGSRYTTDPTTLTLPLAGVTYVELPSGSTWQSMDLGDSSGILIVHNTDLNAQMLNVNSGTFKGVIIVDDLVHVHNTNIGAVINLTTSPSFGNCIGNGTGSVLYSKIAVDTALNAVAQWTMLSWRDEY